VTRLVAAALIGLALVAPARAEAPAGLCAAPSELIRLHGTLARTALRIARREPLTIVAIGSSSTAGSGASAPSRTYPSQLAEELRRQLPGETVAVLNKGIGGETTDKMLRRFDRDVFAHRPDLVIWQLGTNAVLRGLDLAARAQNVRQGLGRLKAAGIDVVLMDMQFAPAVTSRPGYREMEDEIASLAKAQGVPLFRRFAVMRHWVEAGQFSAATMLAPDGLHMNDASYRCLGRMLADAIVDDARPAVATATARR
jgi:lysophospholipase L1-like esterase